MTNLFHKLVLGVATVGIICSGSVLSNAKEIPCNLPAAAGKVAPPAPSTGPSNQFRIIWHIATQIEPLADAAGNAEAVSDIRAAQSHVSGYFINTLMGGPLIYWPGRPKECRLNFKRIANGDSIEVEGQNYTFAEGGAGGRAVCQKQQDADMKTRSNADNPGRDVQIDALQRVFQNLNLASEQKSGKSIWGSALIQPTDFSYDKATDKVSMTQLPDTYCVLNGSGITPNAVMIYQEPKLQIQRNKFVWIPSKNRNGIVKFTKQRRDTIPENPHAFQLLAESFDAASVPTGGFLANVRRWNGDHSERFARELAKIPQFGGFNFEGGTGMLAFAKKSPDYLIKGVSWVLANTKNDVSFLMPGYWNRDMVGNEAEIDTQIDRLRQLVTIINEGLNTTMKLPKGQNAICSNRLAFIVGSYGQPVHVKSLPMRRANGKLAGTVTGQIQLLSDVRKEFCGG